MEKTFKMKRLGLFIKFCKSSHQAGQEHAATHRATRLCENVRVATIHRQISRFLIFKLIPGPLLDEHAEDAWVSKALQVLASVHSTPVIEGISNHYHGENLRNRLEHDFEFVKQWPGIGADKVNVIGDSILHPELSLTKLQKVRPVFGHGDFRGGNLICTPSGEVVPVDWCDSGLCDPRYEWAHFLNSLDCLSGSETGIERFGKLARKLVCPDVDRQDFERDLRIGEIIDRVILAGSKARAASTYGENMERVATLNKQVKRLKEII